MDRGIEKKKVTVEQILDNGKSEMRSVADWLKSDDYESEDDTGGGYRVVSSEADDTLGNIMTNLRSLLDDEDEGYKNKEKVRDWFKVFDPTLTIQFDDGEGGDERLELMMSWWKNQ